MAALGIDIGGSGIKGALVDTRRGVLTTDRLRIKTPRPATPDAVVEVVGQVIAQLPPCGVVGVTFPGVIRSGVVATAPNLHKTWIGADLPALLNDRFGVEAVSINDGDAAAVAESAYGVARGVEGLVVLLTFGTGVGSGMVLDGRLVPNTELGHLEFGGREAERQVAESVRKKNAWSWKKWAKHVNDYLAEVEALFSPDLLVIGGGIDKASPEWHPLLKTRAEVKVAALGNLAGIIGAARTAQRVRTTGRQRLQPAADGPGGRVRLSARPE